MWLAVAALMGILPLSSTSTSASNSQPVKAKEVCYDGVGCLSLESPWDHLWGCIPQPPSYMGLRFYHRSRLFPQRREIMDVGELRKRIPWRQLDSLHGCTVIFHGFASSSIKDWVTELENALLESGDLEVFSVDWSQGAAGPNYLQAVANTRVVGALVAAFLKKFIKEKYCSPSKLHLIGQSLGAHLASYVATNLTNVAEITGLDPAQPWFENNAIETHLDPTDAEFVQVIHTNVLPFWPNFGLGISKPSGHVDFYINGGAIQPGCTNDERFLNYLSVKLAGMVEWFACSHLKAQQYYIDALNRPLSCKYTGIPWEPDKKDPPSSKDQQLRCSFTTCQQLGSLSKYLPARGSFYIFTNYTDTASYCFNEDTDNKRSSYPSENSTLNQVFHEMKL